ncbi:hypothetical protein OG354_25215 [Streptomyces canus]|nr:hypothetical protein [Streptomyces canus]
MDPGGRVEFERVVPASGNLQVAGKQFWLGPARSGLTVTFWADTSVIHLLVAGARIKTVRSHLSVADLGRLAAGGGRAAGPAPLPAGDGVAFEVDRVVNNSGLVGLGGHQVLAAEILGGRQVGIRIDEETLSFFDLASRELLRVRPNPLTSEEVRRLRGLRPLARHRVPVSSRCGCSGGSARWARSWSAARSCPSAARTQARP